MMVFDEWHKGVHVVYIIISTYKTRDLSPLMDALKKSLFLVKVDYHLNAFIVDDAQAKINSLRYMMTQPLLFIIGGFLSQVTSFKTLQKT
jgi:hypothetical protein